MSVPLYPAYKDSGVDWLGKIPSHWQIIQSRRLFRERKEKARPDDEQLTASQKYGVIYQRDFMEIEGQKVVQVIGGSDILKHVEPDDFVISMRSFQGGIEWCGLKGSTSSAYVPLIPVRNVLPAFFRYLLKSLVYIQALQSTTNLVRDGQALRFENFTQIDLPVIPIAEQRSIAAFLDRETAKIDALIDCQQHLIELLKEKRHAAITHAVTKGLDPSAPMKHSGVDWLGPVPKHWRILPLKAVIGYQEGPGIMAVDFTDRGVPLVRVSGIQGKWVTLKGANWLDPEKVERQWGHFKLNMGDLVLSASASLGAIAEVGKEAAGAIPYTGLIRLFPIENSITKDHIRYLMVSSLIIEQIALMAQGATMQHFGPTHLSRMFILLPPRNEQEDIARHLTSTLDHLDALTSEAQAAISLLHERRGSLISAAVTGKIDVRGLVSAEAEAA